jgi:hypothetical protein
MMDGLIDGVNGIAMDSYVDMDIENNIVNLFSTIQI